MEAFVPNIMSAKARFAQEFVLL